MLFTVMTYANATDGCDRSQTVSFSTITEAYSFHSERIRNKRVVWSVVVMLSARGPEIQRIYRRPVDKPVLGC